jgi:catechol 2,3-dioxygenase-like lactoylglutathione lyase family enzyme
MSRLIVRRHTGMGTALVLAFVVGLSALAASHAPDSAPLRVSTVDSIGLTVSDMDRALAFYTTTLPFVKVSDVDVSGRAYELLTGVFGARSRIARLRLGTEEIELTEFLTPKGRPMPADLRSNDRLFQHIAIVVRDIDKAYARLRQHGVEHASTGPQRLPDWNTNAGGISAFYFRDPDRHFLELIAFPPGKGQARWQDAGEENFLGVDHTAIVVNDTDATLRLYRDVLGMRVAGRSENYDVEQEHLNNVFGARLRITALHAERGPGIELLEYLVPATAGRRRPTFAPTTSRTGRRRSKRPGWSRCSGSHGNTKSRWCLQARSTAVTGRSPFAAPRSFAMPTVTRCGSSLGSHVKSRSC